MESSALALKQFVSQGVCAVNQIQRLKLIMLGSQEPH